MYKFDVLKGDALSVVVCKALGYQCWRITRDDSYDCYQMIAPDEAEQWMKWNEKKQFGYTLLRDDQWGEVIHARCFYDLPQWSQSIEEAWRLEELIDVESVRDNQMWWEWPSPKARYIHELCKECDVTYDAKDVAEWYDGWQMTYLGMWKLIHATPEQRCHAWLKTKETDGND